jgi:hypothetical protein
VQKTKSEEEEKFSLPRNSETKFVFGTLNMEMRVHYSMINCSRCIHKIRRGCVDQESRKINFFSFAQNVF